MAKMIDYMFYIFYHNKRNTKKTAVADRKRQVITYGILIHC